MFEKTVSRKEVPKALGAEALWRQRKLGPLLIRAHGKEGEERAQCSCRVEPGTYGILSPISGTHKKEGQKDVEAQLQAQLAYS